MINFVAFMEQSRESDRYVCCMHHMNEFTLSIWIHLLCGEWRVGKKNHFNDTARSRMYLLLLFFFNTIHYLSLLSWLLSLLSVLCFMSQWFSLSSIFLSFLLHRIASSCCDLHSMLLIEHIYTYMQYILYNLYMECTTQHNTQTHLMSTKTTLRCHRVEFGWQRHIALGNTHMHTSFVRMWTPL